jgi:hypothetical protein
MYLTDYISLQPAFVCVRLDIGRMGLSQVLVFCCITFFGWLYISTICTRCLNDYILLDLLPTITGKSNFWGNFNHFTQPLLITSYRVSIVPYFYDKLNTVDLFIKGSSFEFESKKVLSGISWLCEKHS